MLHEIPPFRFDPARDAWIEDDAPLPSPQAPAAIDLATWNVWFLPYAFEERFRAVLAILGARRPEVICLQEIIPESLAMLLAEPWVRAEYRISDARGDTFDGYGVVLFTRLPVRALGLHELPSNMGRRLVVAELDAGGAPLVVGTVHLESLKHNADARADQLAEIFPILRAAGSDAVLCGDFNFCSSWRKENATLDPEFVDLWPALRGGAPGYTEDTDVNAMLRNVKGGEKNVRFDRILLRGTRYRPRAVELLGTAPIAPSAPDVFPSDHFGLAATLAP